MVSVKLVWEGTMCTACLDPKTPQQTHHPERNQQQKHSRKNELGYTRVYLVASGTFKYTATFQMPYIVFSHTTRMQALIQTSVAHLQCEHLYVALGTERFLETKLHMPRNFTSCEINTIVGHAIEYAHEIKRRYRHLTRRRFEVETHCRCRTRDRHTPTHPKLACVQH